MHADLGAIVSLDDLLSMGREGLLRAARSFDPGRGVPFGAWAFRRVRGALLDATRSAHRRRLTLRVGPGAGRDRDDDAVDGADTEAATPEDEVARRQLARRIHETMDELPRSERSLIGLVYFKGLTLDEAARRLGRSRSWGSRRHRRAMAAMSRRLSDDGASSC
jgi:RNA polymerase sigma factor for flagellar operon FliA